MSTRDFTKVVVRELPPMLQEADCKAAFDKEFADRYNWFSFSKGKHGQVPQRARCSAGSCTIKMSSACHVLNTPLFQLRQAQDDQELDSIPELQERRRCDRLQVAF